MKEIKNEEKKELTIRLSDGKVLAILCGMAVLAIPVKVNSVYEAHTEKIDEQRKKPIEQKLHKDKYELMNDKTIKIVKLINKKDETEYHLIKEYNYRGLEALGEKYDILQPNRDVYSNPAALTYYVDLLSTDVVAIVETNYGVLSKNRISIINEIVDEKYAFDYAFSYYGAKEYYTLDELADMLDDLNAKEKVKTKRLTNN